MNIKSLFFITSGLMLLVLIIVFLFVRYNVSFRFPVISEEQEINQEYQKKYHLNDTSNINFKKLESALNNLKGV